MKITVEFEFPEAYERIPDEMLFANVLKSFPVTGIKMKVINRIDSSKVTFDSIEKAFCECFGYSTNELQLKTRKREIKEGRQILHYLARKFQLGTFSEIGFRFGKKDHATAMNSCKKVSEYLTYDKLFVEKYGEFINSFLRNENIH